MPTLRGGAVICIFLGMAIFSFFMAGLTAGYGLAIHVFEKWIKR